jgi:hypothetical protein
MQDIFILFNLPMYEHNFLPYDISLHFGHGE